MRETPEITWDTKSKQLNCSCLARRKTGYQSYVCVCVCVWACVSATHTHTQMHGAIPDYVIVKKLMLRAQREKTQNYHTHTHDGGGGDTALTISASCPVPSLGKKEEEEEEKKKELAIVWMDSKGPSVRSSSPSPCYIHRGCSRSALPK